MHQLDPDQRVLGCLKRLDPEHGAGDPLHASVVLFDYIIQIFHLTDDNAGAVFLVVALDRGFIRVTAVNGDLLGDPMTADGFLQKPEGRLFIAVLGEQEVNGLALLIYRTVEIAPLASG